MNMPRAEGYAAWFFKTSCQAEEIEKLHIPDIWGITESSTENLIPYVLQG